MTTFRIYDRNILNGTIRSYIHDIIPADTTILDLHQCKSLKTLPELPARLKILNLFGCSSLTTLPTLTASLKSLNLSNCSKLETLPELPVGLKELNLSNCTELTSLPKLPPGLRWFNPSNCFNLKILPELPPGLNEIDLSYCTELTSLPELPRGLKGLNLYRCRNLTTLPTLPAGLKELDLFGCSSLTTLPDLPASIKYLDLSTCTSLSPESIPKLLALEKANRGNPRFRLIWPAHLVNNNQAITSLKESYRTYYANHSSLSRTEPSIQNRHHFQTLKLFQRFTSENLVDRGKKEVIAQAILVAKEIKKNPELLEILDKVSSNYLTACVNQPVNGFLEIASLMAIAKEDNITAKIAKAKILRTQQLIKNNISSLRNLSNQTVSRGIEVELGNAMIREVHNKLLEEKVIKEPWLGIPRNISYEGSIQSFLTEENILEMTDLAQEALLAGNSEQEAIEFLCATKPEFWAKIIFSKEEREDFDQKHNDRIKQLREQIIELDPSNADGLNKIIQLQQQIKEIEEEKSTEFDKKLKQRTEELTKITKSDQDSHQSRSPRDLSLRDLSPRHPQHEEAGGVFGRSSDQRDSASAEARLINISTSPRLDGQANTEASQVFLSSITPKAIETDPSSLTSGQTLLRRGLFERLATRNQYELRALSARTETNQNQLSEDLVLLNQDSSSHHRPSPRSQTASAESNALEGQTTSTRTSGRPG